MGFVHTAYAEWSNFAVYRAAALVRLSISGIILVMLSGLFQPALSVDEVTVPAASPTPIIHAEYATHRFIVPITRSLNNIPGHLFAYGPKTNQFYTRIVYDNAPLHRFSMDGGMMDSFSTYPMPRTTRLFAEDPSTGDILFWDDSVGKVFTMTQEGAVKRIDQSFTHRNQYGHAPWISPEGDIYAFGGYGLFTSKSIVTYFTRDKRSWSLLHLEDKSSQPPPQSEAMAVTDFPRNQVYIIAKRNSLTPTSPNHNIQTEQGVWRLLLDERRYEYVGEITLPRTRVNSTLAMHPSGDFFLIPVSLPGVANVDLMAYFPGSGKQIKMSELGIRTGATDGLHYVFWSDADQAFYFVHRLWIVAADEFVITLNRISIPDPDAFVMAYGMATQDIPLVRYVFIAMLFVFAIVVQWYRKRMDTSVEDMTDVISQVNSNETVQGHELNTLIAEVLEAAAEATSQPGKNPIDDAVHPFNDDAPYPVMDGAACRIVVSGKANHIRIYTPQGDKLEVDTPYEVKLLTLLVRNQSQVPSKFTLSDDIDALLIPNHPSPDYIRRIRNLTITRISEILDQTGTTDLLLRRKNKIDKRKTEYKLSDLVQITLLHQ